MHGMHAKRTLTRVECVALCLEALPVAYWDHHEQYSTLVANLDVACCCFKGEAQKKKRNDAKFRDSKHEEPEIKEKTLRICPRHALGPRHLPTATAHETWMDSFHQREPDVCWRQVGQLDSWTAGQPTFEFCEQNTKLIPFPVLQRFCKYSFQ